MDELLLGAHAGQKVGQTGIAILHQHTSHHRAAQVTIHKDYLLARLCQSNGQIQRSNGFPLVGQTAGHTDAVTTALGQGKSNVGTQRLIGYLHNEAAVRTKNRTALGSETLSRILLCLFLLKKFHGHHRSPFFSVLAT